MIKKCFPDFCIKNINELDEAFYIKNNIKAVIFDIDNTLVIHKEAYPTKEVLEYFDFLKSIGIKYGIVSNNKEARVKPFCEKLDVPYAYRAFKPRKKHLRIVADELGVSYNNICFVGDQVFTDILGANRMGFVSVIVEALGENETGFVAFKRIFERMVMDKYHSKVDKNV